MCPARAGEETIAGLVTRLRGATSGWQEAEDARAELQKHLDAAMAMLRSQAAYEQSLIGQNDAAAAVAVTSAPGAAGGTTTGTPAMRRATANSAGPAAATMTAAGPAAAKTAGLLAAATAAGPAVAPRGPSSTTTTSDRRTTPTTSVASRLAPQPQPQFPGSSPPAATQVADVDDDPF